MLPPTDSRRTRDARIARARQLAAAHAAAAELLTFYAAVTEFQHGVAADSLERAAESVPDFLACLERVAPGPLAAAASEMRTVPAAVWRRRFSQYWNGDALQDWASEAPPHDGVAREAPRFVVEMLVQPFAEARAAVSCAPADAPPGKAAICPSCRNTPIVSVLREAGQGARRSLVCGLCLTEWPWPRLVCPACGEHAAGAQVSYRADAYPAARVEACDTCRHFVTTIDTTVDPAAVPVVDELAVVALDLWAREAGYTKIRPNMLQM